MVYTFQNPLRPYICERTGKNVFKNSFLLSDNSPSVVVQNSLRLLKNILMTSRYVFFVLSAVKATML